MEKEIIKSIMPDISEEQIEKLIEIGETKKVRNPILCKYLQLQGLEVQCTGNITEKKVKRFSAPQIQQFIPTESFKQFKNIIAIHSTKGGVGKTTIAVLLSLALKHLGAKVGLLDVDFLGPNVPNLLKSTELVKSREDKIIPLNISGMKVLSLGYFPNIGGLKGRPIVWRGPLITSTLQQLFSDTLWIEEGEEPLDFLVLDLPPGTGDIPITLAQQIPMTGVIAVTTPQILSVQDTVRTLGFFRTFDINILGLVLNQSYLICPHCGNTISLKFTQVVDEVLRDEKLDLLEEIPMDLKLMELQDTGSIDDLDKISLDLKNKIMRLAVKVAIKIELLGNVEG